MPITPYVVGQWVRDERFYGRRALIEEILEGNRNCLWVLGTRRVGKTSLLKQLEHLTANAARPRWFPLFWDFQGSEEVADLHLGFRDALIDAGDRLSTLGIPFGEVDDGDLFVALAKLRRELRSRDLSLLLLGDEVEELVGIRERDPRFLRRLRRALQSAENLRTVLASTIRLWSLSAESATTSPFLHGFTPPLALRGLEDEEASALVRQDGLPAGARPRLDAAAVEAIRARCNNHPYLLQLLGERRLELGDLEAAIEAVASDPMVSFFFAADLGLLEEGERRILRLIDERDGATSRTVQERLAPSIRTAGTAGGPGAASPASASVAAGLRRLELLGFVRRSPAGEYSLANPFFRRWLAELPESSVPVRRSASAALGDGPTIRTPRPGESGGSSDSAARPTRIDDRYELLARLGRGASGEVYKAHDALLRTVVAVKLLRPEYCLDEEALERLRREVVLARDLSHPNLLKLYHLGDDGGRRYITMQFVDGPDLARVIAGEAPIAPSAAVSIGAKLASALAALHGREVLHRDLKPSNVLIDERGEPRITDFGLARLKSAPGVTQSGTFLGTPAYASPEQALGESLDERSDLYALGLILFEMVTGRGPFVAETVQAHLALRLGSEPPSPRALVPSIPEPLSELILRCLARDRAHRFASAQELHSALEALAPAARPA